MSQATNLNQNQLPTKMILQDPRKAQAEGFMATIKFLINPMEFLEASHQRYGEIFTVKIPGFNRMVIVSNPELVEAVFTADSSIFDVSVSTQILRPIVGAKSMLMMEGLAHKRERKLLMPPFHGERMVTYGQLIRDITKQLIDQWSPGNLLSIRSYSQDITLRVMLSAVFGVKEGARYEQLRSYLSSFFDSLSSPLGSGMLFLRFLQRDLGPMSPWGNFRRLKKQIDDVLFAEIRERRTQPLGEDILSLMMSARDEQGQSMTDEELRDELMTLMFGGNETSANTLAWALYTIHHHSEVREKLLEELNTLPTNADPKTITKLPYLNAVVCETLRLYPVVLFSFGRKVKSPFEVNGYRFEPGTIVAPCLYLTHHRPDIYPEPMSFKPERFLERQFSPYEYYPFGGANRRCLGAAFAMFEIKMVLATILSQVQLTLANNRPVRPLPRGVTISPSEIKMMVTG